MGYVVTGAYVTAITDTTFGRTLIGFYQGAPLPDDVSQREIDHLLDVGLIAAVEEPKKAAK
jgi:hypothetical protein